MKMKTDSKFYWRLMFIGIPLLPFVIGGIIKIVTICLSGNFDFTIYNIVKALYFSWDTVAFSFSISIMAFFVKNDLTEQKVILPNQDKLKDISDSSILLFIYGIVNLIVFGILLFIHTRLKDCGITDLKGLHVFFSILTYLLGYFTIKKAMGVQHKFDLTAKYLF